MGREGERSVPDAGPRGPAVQTRARRPHHRAHAVLRRGLFPTGRRDHPGSCGRGEARAGEEEGEGGVRERGVDVFGSLAQKEAGH